MDRFKFRGRAIDDGSGFEGQWITGYYRPNPINTDRGKIHRWHDKYGWSGIAVDPKTVGQCTGLKDKNGKLIYEGDEIQAIIIPAPSVATRGHIVWHDDGYWGNKNEAGMTPLFNLHSIAVIGNIHEAESE